MKRKIFYIFFILIISDIIFSFSSCNSCKSTGDPEQRYRRTSARLLGNGVPADSITGMDTTLLFLAWDISSVSTPVQEYPGIPGFSSPALACDPYIYFTDTDPVDSIRIISDSLFDAKHPAGSSLNDLVVFSTYCNGILSDIPLDSFRHYTSANTQYEPRQNLTLRLTSKAISGKASVYAQYRFRSGEIRKSSTLKIRWN